METNTVMNTAFENVPADAVQAQGIDSDALFAAQTEPVTDTAQESAPEQEPRWLQGRVNDLVNRQLKQQVDEITERVRRETAAAYEARLKPLQDAMIEREADQLVASGEFKTRDRALEYVRLKTNAPAAVEPEPVPQERPRDAQGRFTTTAPAASPDVQARAAELFNQARGITQLGGPDVMSEYRNNPEVHQKVNSGEWNFFDVAQHMGQGGRSPSLVRSPNGTAAGRVDILNMSDEQFDKLNDSLRKGGRLSV